MDKQSHGTGIPLYGCDHPFALLTPMEYQHFKRVDYLAKGFFVFVSHYNRLGLMNQEGKGIIDARWDEIQMDPDYGVIRCIIDDCTVLYDFDGNTLTGRPVHELTAAGSGVSVLDQNGNIKVLDKLSAFREGYARSNTGRNTYYINPKGQIVLTVEGYDCGDFCEGYAVARKRNGLFKRDTWAFIDQTGAFLVPPQYRAVQPFSCGVAVVEDAQGRRFLTTNRTSPQCYKMVDGEQKMLPFPTKVDAFVNHFAAALYMGKSRGYVLDGVPFSVPEEDGGYVVLHKSGALTHNKRYNNLISSGIGNRFIFNDAPQADGKLLYGVMDAWGKVLIGAAYDRIYPYGEEYFLLERDGKSGLADKNGKIITEAQWDKLLLVREGAFNVSRNGQWGLLGMDGNWIFPLGKEGPYILCAGAVLTGEGTNLRFCNLQNQSAMPDAVEPVQMIYPGLMLVKYEGSYCVLNYGFSPETT